MHPLARIPRRLDSIDGRHLGFCFEQVRRALRRFLDRRGGGSDRWSASLRAPRDELIDVIAGLCLGEAGDLSVGDRAPGLSRSGSESGADVAELATIRKRLPCRTARISSGTRSPLFRIERVPSHEQLLLQAIAVARDARAHGNHPFGALLADQDGRVLLTAENTVVTTRDVTGHAETNLVRTATVAYSPADLADTALYTSTEPCAMCAGAIYWSGIGSVIYALAETSLCELAGNDPENLTLALPCRDVFGAGRRPITVFGPFELTEAEQVHAGFWRPLSDA